MSTARWEEWGEGLAEIYINEQTLRNVTTQRFPNEKLGRVKAIKCYCGTGATGSHGPLVRAPLIGLTELQLAHSFINLAAVFLIWLIYAIY